MLIIINKYLFHMRKTHCKYFKTESTTKIKTSRKKQVIIINEAGG
jgi:hypothetical protein